MNWIENTRNFASKKSKARFSLHFTIFNFFILFTAILKLDGNRK